MITWARKHVQIEHETIPIKELNQGNYTLVIKGNSAENFKILSFVKSMFKLGICSRSNFVKSK